MSQAGIWSFLRLFSGPESIARNPSTALSTGARAGGACGRRSLPTIRPVHRRAGGRVASRRRPSTPSARKRSRQRHTARFDIPVRRAVSIKPWPEPSQGRCAPARRASGGSAGGPDPFKASALPVRQPDLPSCRFPARPPLSRFACRSQRRRESDMTLPKEMESLVLSHTLVPYLKLIVHGSPRLQPPRCHPDRPQGKRLRHDQMTHQRVNPLK